jgi:RND family efflux transporter MFP subunit
MPTVRDDTRGAPGIRASRTDREMTMHQSTSFRFGVLSLLLMAVACGNAEAGDPEAATAEDGTGSGFVRVINVETAEVAPETFLEQVRLTGVVEASRDVRVSAEESGTIVETLLEKGARVQAGQPLMRIDDRILRSQVDQARAAAQLAQETWQRRKRLWEEDQVGSELAYLEAKYAAEQADANLRNLQERLARTVIRAPIEGVLEDRMVETGTLVSPGTVVARVVDVNPVKINAGVPERYAPDVHVGAPATVTFDVLPEASAEATVNFVGAAVDARNRTFPVELRLPNSNGLIKPEMVANVSIQRRRMEGALVVPQDAVVRIAEGYQVFVVEGEGDDAVARARAVTLGPSQGNRVVVSEGLQPGDRLVVMGQKNVADGDRVRVVGGGA